MPMLYDRFDFYPSGVLGVLPIETPWDGRRIYLELPPDAQYRLFTVIDGNLTEFSNGSPMETPRSGVERFVRFPHSTRVIAVRLGGFALPDAVLDLNPIPVRLSSGEIAAVRLHCELHAGLWVSDPELLAESFVSGELSGDPESAAFEEVKLALREAIVHSAASHFRGSTAERALSTLDELSLELKPEVEDRLRAVLPWARLARFESRLVADNAEELRRAANRLFELDLENRRKLLDAVLTVYADHTVPAQIGTILAAYLQSNPGASGADVIAVCGNLKTLCERSSPERLLAAAQSNGFLKGGVNGVLP